MSIAENIEHVRNEMRLACERSGRKIEDVTLIAVTKYVETARIQEAMDAGITEIGENRAQEFTEKLTFYKQNRLRTDFIGQLQTNKVKYICGNAVPDPQTGSDPHFHRYILLYLFAVVQ